jgi:hypothetical protein
MHGSVQSSRNFYENNAHPSAERETISAPKTWYSAWYSTWYSAPGTATDIANGTHNERLEYRDPRTDRRQDVPIDL